MYYNYYNYNYFSELILFLVVMRKSANGYLVV